MPEATIRVVDELDLQRALTLLDSAGKLTQCYTATNVYPLQLQISSVCEDMIAYAKELLKTPPPPAEDAAKGSAQTE